MRYARDRQTERHAHHNTPHPYRGTVINNSSAEMANQLFTSFTNTKLRLFVIDYPLTVVHLLLECPLYTTIRGKYFSVLSMEELFHTIKARNILAFIREVGFYHHTS